MALASMTVYRASSNPLDLFSTSMNQRAPVISLTLLRPGLVSEAYVDDACLVTDHRILHCKLRLNRATSRPVAITFRRLHEIYCTEFEGSLLRSSLSLNPASAADAFADQLASVVTEELNRDAPLRTTSRRQSKPITRWLSKEAVAAKRERRRLENIWKARHLEADCCPIDNVAAPPRR